MMDHRKVYKLEGEG